MSESFLRLRMLCYSLCILLAGFTGCSCQSEDAAMANPEAVYQQYQVTYDGDVNHTTVEARFRFGGFTGTNLRLTGAAGVKHDRYKMNESSFLGVHYNGGGEGFQAEHTFEYTDIQGKVRKNSVRLARIDFAPEMPAVITRGKDVRISLAGDLLQGAETARPGRRSLQHAATCRRHGSPAPRRQIRTLRRRSDDAQSGMLEQPSIARRDVARRHHANHLQDCGTKGHDRQVKRRRRDLHDLRYA